MYMKFFRTVTSSDLTLVHLVSGVIYACDVGSCFVLSLLHFFEMLSCWHTHTQGNVGTPEEVRRIGKKAAGCGNLSTLQPCETISMFDVS